MPFGLSPVVASVIALVAGCVLAVVVWFALDVDGDGEQYPPRDGDDELPEEVDLQPPTIKGSRFGFIGQLWKVRTYLKKREKLAAKGYVQWYFIDDAYPTPKFVKPTEMGGGVREIEKDGGIYLFPDRGRLPAAEQGIWTYFHTRGEPKPLNMNDPGYPGMSAEAVKEYATMRVTSSPPSLLDKFDLNGEDAVKYGLGILIALVGVQAVLGGGL